MPKPTEDTLTAYMRLAAFFSFALPLGVGTVLISKTLAYLWVFGTLNPTYEQVTLESYGALLMNLMGFYLLLLMVPKAFIYFKGSGKHRYKFLIYFGLPVLCWLFLPTTSLLFLAWSIIASAAYAEAIDLALKMEVERKKKR